MLRKRRRNVSARSVAPSPPPIARVTSGHYVKIARPVGSSLAHSSPWVLRPVMNHHLFDIRGFSCVEFLKFGERLGRGHTRLRAPPISMPRDVFTSSAIDHNSLSRG